MELYCRQGSIGCGATSQNNGFQQLKNIYIKKSYENTLIFIVVDAMIREVVILPMPLYIFGIEGLGGLKVGGMWRFPAGQEQHKKIKEVLRTLQE